MNRPSETPRTVFEIVSVGNELLIGRVVNTNAHWMAGVITGLGGFVRRVTVVRDELDEISSVTRAALDRGADWLIVSGGLGPTYDDMTLQGVALALNRRLELNQEAVVMIKEHYATLVQKGLAKEFELTPARVKMATLPEGSTPLRNSVGTAPGVLVREEETSIVCLPGVPRELEAIFKESLIPLFKKSVGEHHAYNLTLHALHIFESSLSPLIDRVMSECPDVYVKSHPKGIEDGVSKIELHIRSTERSAEVAHAAAKKAADALTALITEAKGVIDRVEEAEEQG